MARERLSGDAYRGCNEEATMTKQSALVTAGALVLGLMAGVVGHDLTQRPPVQGPQIVIQLGPTGATASAAPTVAGPRGGDRG
jgi:hypothetical protein